MSSQAAISANPPLADRMDRLSAIVGNHSLTDDLPLLKVLPLSEAALGRLQCTVNYYLWTSLSSYFPTKQFRMECDLLEAYASDVMALPNITPNGLMLPKKENLLAYNEIHRQVASVFTQLNIESHVESIHAPINIRIVDGTADPVKAARPRAATKPHSDIWAGESASAIMIFIPLLGDATKANVRFMEPLEFPERFARPLDDFDEGRELVTRAVSYDAALTPGYIYLCDPFLLHQTVKRGPGLRLSLDFRFIAREKLQSDHHDGRSRMANYLRLDEWCGFGVDRLVTTEARLEPFKGDDNVRDSYAAPYKFVKI